MFITVYFRKTNIRIYGHEFAMVSTLDKISQMKEDYTDILV